MSSAATAAFNEEQIAQAFLERLKVCMPNSTSNEPCLIQCLDITCYQVFSEHG